MIRRFCVLFVAFLLLATAAVAGVVWHNLQAQRVQAVQSR